MILLWIYLVVALIVALSILFECRLTGGKHTYRIIREDAAKASEGYYHREVWARACVVLLGGIFWPVILHFRQQELYDTERARE